MRGTGPPPIRLRPIKTLIGLNIKLAVKTPSPQLGAWLSKELEALGPTYVKMGQFISSRKDIFTKEFSDQFASLRDRVRPMPPELVEPIFKALADKIQVEPEPLASASIGQVHKGVLLLNEAKPKVIVKVRRPNIAIDIANDIGFIRSVLDLMKLLNTNDNVDDTIDILTDFESGVLEEVDFKKEVENIKMFRRLYKSGVDGVYIPKVYKSLCTDDVIVMEYVKTKPIFSIVGKDRRKAMATKIIKIFIEQLIQTGSIHGDPHPGNMGVRSDNTLVLYDFGNVVKVGYNEQQLLKELIYYLLVMNKGATVATLKKLKIKITDDAEVERYLDSYIEYMRSIDVNKLKSLTNNGKAEMPFKLTGELFRLIRVFGILEGICKELDPEFNYFDVLQDYVTDILFDQEFLTYKASSDINSLINRPQPVVTSQSQKASSSPLLSNAVTILNILLLLMLLYK